MNLPRIESEYFPFGGGLDLMTPPIALKPGRVFAAKNYEPEISGGYRRMDGFERFDGRQSPTSADYWILSVVATGTIVDGSTLTGATSGATCKVLSVVGTDVIAGRLTGSFTVGENLTSGGIVGTVAEVEELTGATTASDDADYAFLAANDLREDILVVPGSGQIRGVWVFNDIVYAFRDNAGATAGDMYKSSAGGWVKITFNTEIQFTGAVGQVVAGNTITGGTSGATATVLVALLRTGSWTVSGVGTLVISTPVGTFQNGEALRVGGVTKVTSSSLATAITRAPGGTMEFCNYNFSGSTSSLKMYGADGVNKAFEFNGTTYVPIRTGQTVDTPTHVIGYHNSLWLSYIGTVQYSGLKEPYSWTAVTGAAEIATGDIVTGFMPQPGTNSGPSMAIFTASKTYTLYGSSSLDFSLVNSIWDIGYSAYTMQTVSNNTYGMTARGIQSLVTTLTYGDFDYASISHEVQTLINQKRGLAIASTSLRTKNQYRVFFSDGTAITVGLTGDKINGILPLDYGIPVRCITTATLSTGEEVTYFGSDDGYVYRDGIGTSFDGEVIESFIRLAFNHSKSPRVRKRYRRGVLEVDVDSYSEVNISYDLGYGTPNTQPAAVSSDRSLNGGGGYWDQFTWEEFFWDSETVVTPSIAIDGTEKNISMLFYSSRAQDQSHTLQGLTLFYSLRRAER